MTLTEQAHKLIKDHFANNNAPLKLAVDATCGNGNDTLFLAEMGFQSVIGFDVQEKAIDKTRTKLLNASFDNVSFHQVGHENLAQYIKQAIDCLIFNFGYLPSADKSVTTESETSMLALADGLARLSTTGILSLICYPGHPEGAEETAAIKRWLETLATNFTVDTYHSQLASDTTPTLFIVTHQ